MDDKPQAAVPHGVAYHFFGSLPAWARSIVVIFTLIPIAMALSGQILGLQSGVYVGKYLDIQLEQMRAMTGESTDMIIKALDEHMKVQDATLAEVSSQVAALVFWACSHSDAQKLTVDRPEFCKE